MYDDKFLPECRTIIIQNELDDDFLNGTQDIVPDVGLEEEVCSSNTPSTMDRLRTYQRKGKNPALRNSKSQLQSKLQPPVIKVKTVHAVKLPSKSGFMKPLKRLDNENQRRRPGVLLEKSQLKSIPEQGSDGLRIATTRFTRSNAATTSPGVPQNGSLNRFSLSSAPLTRRSLPKSGPPPIQTTIITKTFTQSNHSSKNPTTNGVISFRQTNLSNKNGIADDSNFFDGTIMKSDGRLLKLSQFSGKGIGDTQQISHSRSSYNQPRSKPDLKTMLTSSNALKSPPPPQDLLPQSQVPTKNPDQVRSLYKRNLVTNSSTSDTTNPSPTSGIPSPPNESPPLIDYISRTHPPTSEDQTRTSGANITTCGSTNSSRNLSSSTLTTTKLSKMQNCSTPQSDDLTSLSWLHSLDMVGMVPHLSTPPTPPASPPLGGNSNSSTGEGKRKNKASQEPMEEPKPDPIDYTQDGSVKPPFSYAALISMAMRENGNKMTLSAIYKWIKEHYIYYTTADPSWQNSIRHNLSLNKSFLKVARSKNEPGKGGFWCLDPSVAETLADGTLRKRRPNKPTSPPISKSTKNKRPNYLGESLSTTLFKPSSGTKSSATYQPGDIVPASNGCNQPHQSQFALASSDGFITSCPTTLDALGPLDGSKVIIHHPMPYLPPPPSVKDRIDTPYFQQEVISERTLTMEEVTTDTLRDDFAWGNLLGEENQEDGWTVCRSQELVTDLTHSGDPSTYSLTTPTSTDLIPSTHHQTSTVEMMSQHHHNSAGSQNHNEYYNNGSGHIQHHQQLHQLPSIDSIHQRPSHIQGGNQVMFNTLELSPRSSKLDDEFFASPEYSEASNDDGDDLASLELQHNLHQQMHSVSSPNTQTWSQTFQGDDLNTQTVMMKHHNTNYTISDNMKLHNMQQHQHSPNHHQHHNPHQQHQQQNSHLHENYNNDQQMLSLPSMSTFRIEDSSNTLTPLEPVATSVIVQDAHAHCWGEDYPWDESKTLSMLDANLDFDHLIDLDVL